MLLRRHIMGNKASLPGSIEADDDTDMTAECRKYTTYPNMHFTERQIRNLCMKYLQLAGTRDLGGDGTIDEDEFVTKMQMRSPRIGHLMFKMIDSDGEGGISFEEFLLGLNSFMPQSPLDNKIRLVFQALDSDGGGSIGREEVQQFLEASLDGNPWVQLNDGEIRELIDDIYEAFARDGSEDLTPDEFSAMIRQSPGIIECFEFDLGSIQ
jgi:serine/threonine-protein phosphatase 2B regulatory subunit